MRRLYYASGSVVTGDILCKAVLRYARALANNEVSDVVSVPVIAEAGDRVMSHFLVGPASQLFSMPIEGNFEELVDDGVVDELERRTARLQPARPMWDQEMKESPGLEDYERGSVDEV